MQVQCCNTSKFARVLSLLLWSALAMTTAKVYANPETTDTQDDILEVVDLPLAAELAKGSGISEDELQESLGLAQNGGMGAAVLSEVLVAEADAVKIRGKKKGLPDWLMTRWAAGVRGVDLKGEVKARPDQAKLDPAKKKELQASIKKQKAQRLQERKAARLALKEQRKAGKKVALRGKSAHARLKQAKGRKHGQDVAAQAKEQGHHGKPATPGANAAAQRKGNKHENPAEHGAAHANRKKHESHGKHGKQHGKPSKAHGHPKGKSAHAGQGKGKSKSGKKGRGKGK